MSQILLIKINKIKMSNFAIPLFDYIRETCLDN